MRIFYAEFISDCSYPIEIYKLNKETRSEANANPLDNNCEDLAVPSLCLLCNFLFLLLILLQLLYNVIVSIISNCDIVVNRQINFNRKNSKLSEKAAFLYIKLINERKKKMKKVIKKLASLLMVTVFVITGTTFQMLAGALSESVINGKQKLYISYYPYSYNFSGSGLGTSIYGQFVKINVGSANGEYAYCMDAEADSGITGTSIFTAEDFNLSDWVKRNYTSNQIKLMKYAAIYTIKNASETKYGYSNEVENIASQIINWTILHNWFNTSSESSVLNVYTANMPSSVASNVKACYNKIKEQILSHKTIPSFAVGKGQTPTPKKMTTNADGTFSITLTDNKNCSSYFDWAKALNNSKIQKLFIDYYQFCR